MLLLVLLTGLFSVQFAHGEMHCLVARPGFGLVSELCPAHSVACRIRIEHEAVSFYEYSPLYDRNQFVCVLKGEFGDQHGSGCVRKRSGHVRCWCFGRSNCNTPENSKLLYSTFVSGDETKFHEAVQQVDFTDLTEEEHPQWALAGTTSTATAIKNGAPSTTEMMGITKIAQKLLGTTTTKVIGTTPSIKQLKPAKIGPTIVAAAPIGSGKESGRELMMIKQGLMSGGRKESPAGKTEREVPPPVESHHHYKHAHLHQKHGHHHHLMMNESSAEPKKVATITTPRTDGNVPTAPPDDEVTNTTIKWTPPKSYPKTKTTMTTTVPTATAAQNGGVVSSTVRSEYDRHNRVHIIHVSARDHYEPVNLFGSPALNRIMEQERKQLQTNQLAADTSAEQSAEDEEDDDDLELEELEEDWEQSGSHENGKGQHQLRRVAERSQQQQPKANAPTKIVKSRLEQRTRSSTSSSSELPEGEEEVLGDEYFDSAFFAPASAASHQQQQILALIAASVLLFTVALIGFTD